MDQNILIITGEPSGDIRAGELLGELKKLLPDTVFWGIGGDSMRENGVELIEHVKNLSMVGVLEVLKKIPRIFSQYRNVTKNIKERKPDFAILIDYPGFNLKIAKFLKKENVPVIYYIIPQVWAWGAGRVKLLKRFTDKILVLFDFEKKFLSDHDTDSEFVGHPLVDKVPSQPAVEAENKDLTIALLPGSRENEIKHIFPVILDAAETIKDHGKNARFTLAENSNIDKKLYDLVLEQHPRLDIERISDNTIGALAKADLAIVTSGTATLETAIMEKPMVVVYRAARLTAFLARKFVKGVFVLGLVNIISGKEIVPEVLQERLTPEILADEVMKIIDNPSRTQEIKNDLRKVKQSLGEKGASLRAAKAIKDFVENHSKNP